MWPVDVEVATGRAGEFHSRPLPDDRTAHLWWFEPEVDAIVLGSTQDERVIDVEACRRHGVEIVKRRSGGGVVLLTKAGTLWLDVVVPVGHPLWDRDITTSAFWLGEAWIAALEASGVGDLVQHRAGLERTPVSDLICFAGRGPGEVFLSSGAKVVGISQRRTRTHARFQCAVSVAWEPARLLGLLCQPRPDLADIAEAGSTIDVDCARLTETASTILVDRLSR